MWYLRFSSTSYNGSANYQWGLRGDVPIVTDFDDDHKTDLVVYRPSTAVWYVSFSSTGYNTGANYQWGLPRDTPLPKP